jgi:anti-sigma factor RsiW
MRFGWRRRSDMLSCREAGRVLQSYLDGEVDEVSARGVAHHLEACRRCGMAAETYTEIKRALRRRGGGVPRDAVERLRAFGEQLSWSGLPPPGEEPAGV